MMVAVQTSETSVNSYQSRRRHDPEESRLQALRLIMRLFKRNVSFQDYIKACVSVKHLDTNVMHVVDCN
jgi:hypothetical protein